MEDCDLSEAVAPPRPTIAEKSDTTVEELRAALDQAPGVFMEGAALADIGTKGEPLDVTPWTAP